MTTEGKGKIIYALVATGVKPLSSYSNFTGTFDQICINYLQKVRPECMMAVKTDNDYIIFYWNHNNITYLIMAENSYPKEVATGCLKSIQKEFENTFPNRSFEDEDKFGLDREFQVKLRMKFDYFNANQDVTDETLTQIKDQLNQMRDDVLNVSGLLNERGEKMKILDEKADSLSRSSNNYYQQSKRVKRAELMKKLKIYGAIGCAILVVLYLIIAIACSPQ